MSHASPLDRRTVVRGAAWSVPAIALATSSPAFARSATPDTCLLVTTASSWSVDTSLAPLRPHVSIPGRLETGWMNTTAGVTTTGTAGGTLVTPAHGDSMVNRPTHDDLTAGSFISWQDAGGNATNDTTTNNTVLTVDYRFTVDGPTDVTIDNRVIFQYGDPKADTSRQTLRIDLLEETSPGTFGSPLWTTKVAAVREKEEAGVLTLYPPSPERNVSQLVHTDAQLRADGFDLIDTVPIIGRHQRTISAAPATLNMGATAGQNRTYVVRYTFTLYPRLWGMAATDDLAIHPPVITTTDGC